MQACQTVKAYAIYAAVTARLSADVLAYSSLGWLGSTGDIGFLHYRRCVRVCRRHGACHAMQWRLPRGSRCLWLLCL